MGLHIGQCCVKGCKCRTAVSRGDLICGCHTAAELKKLGLKRGKFSTSSKKKPIKRKKAAKKSGKKPAKKSKRSGSAKRRRSK